MKKADINDPDMRDEYDFTGGVRGKHYQQYMAGTNVVVLDPDVSKMFPDSESVNKALRAMGRIIAQHNRRSRREIGQRRRTAAGT